MRQGFDGVVITGPNTGGKTVTIKTVALNCMMAQCGLHVTCKKAEICMNSNFLCDIGDGQNISENLSALSAHIVKVLEILKKVNRDSLVVMDELGSGTDPTEGVGIAIAILEKLQKSGGLFLVTTHYPEVKQKMQPDFEKSGCCCLHIVTIRPSDPLFYICHKFQHCVQTMFHGHLHRCNSLIIWLVIIGSLLDQIPRYT